jgi:hypothetical protein
MVIRPQFIQVGPFIDGVAWARAREDVPGDEVRGKVGFIDKSGKTVIQPAYEDALIGFCEGLCAVSVARPGKHDGNVGRIKWGFIDKTGAFVIKPLYEAAEEFWNGLAYVKLEGEWYTSTEQERSCGATPACQRQRRAPARRRHRRIVDIRVFIGQGAMFNVHMPFRKRRVRG